MKEGRQIYALAPAVDETKSGELQTATELRDRMQRTFPHRRVGLLHGRMKTSEREETMARFSEGEIDILACTTVIEVGVDVPNATVMLIEDAERFGLSQLHQLRGRVGRGAHRGYCILICKQTEGGTGAEELKPALRRLEIMAKTHDGFEIAEKDLELRGPGDFAGIRQSGLPALRIGNLVRNVGLLRQARDEAFRLIFEPQPGEEAERQELIEVVERTWERRYGLALIG